MKLHIIIDSQHADTLTPLWAAEELDVDYRGEPERATRCTEAFAATELKRLLAKAVPDLECVFACKPAAEALCIRLETRDPASREDGFDIDVHGHAVVIRGDGRTGTLHGAYELLRHQGWRWIEPGARGEVYVGSAELSLPKSSSRHESAFPLGRGFDFNAVSMESGDLLLWMARNRLNLASYRPATFALANKLGMTFRNGGHIFEPLLDPERPAACGDTLWDTHRDWFGLPANGERNRATAQKIQFCMSNEECADYLAESVIHRLETDWAQLDFLNIWQFDTWGSSCQCAGCRALGNDSDQYLHFGAGLRRRINAAVASGRLSHAPRLVLCAYEGGCSMEAPTRSVPDVLATAGDVIVFYPINRCYEHDFFDADCHVNARYAEFLTGWLEAAPKLPILMGEYYGVSKFEDLPLPFRDRIAADIPAYAAHGVAGMTYMHVPMVEWGVRRLTQCLYAAVASSPGTVADDFVRDHLQASYGSHAERMREAYDAIETAWLKIADWRSWSPRSVLYHLQDWNGKTPITEFDCGGTHFLSEPDMVAHGQESVRLLETALETIEDCHCQAWREAARMLLGADPGQAVNPRELEKQMQGDGRVKRLAGDRRGLRYGRDVMRLMTELTAYHLALLNGDSEAAERVLKTARETAAALEDRSVPLNYTTPYPGFACQDGLTRSQLEQTLQRCLVQE